MSAPKVFVSYAAADADWARQFSEALKAHGVDVWLDTLKIRAGTRIEEKLERALKECDVLVSIVTPESANSPNLFFELGAAFAMGKVVIPIVSKDAKKVPAHLSLRQHLVRSSPMNTAKRLSEQLKLEAVAG